MRTTVRRPDVMIEDSQDNVDIHLKLDDNSFLPHPPYSFPHEKQ